MKSINYWLIFYELFFIAAFQFLFHEMIEFETTIVSNIIVFVVGGLFGFFVEKLVNKSNNWLKISVIAIVLAIILLVKYFNSSVDKLTFYKSCEICGYIAVDEEGFCNSCFGNSWKIDKETGDYDNHEDWLIEMQLETFVLDSINQNNVFQLSDSQKIFKRDSTWKPSISISDLIKEFKEYSKSTNEAN
jgi:hypothetical protein